MKNFSLIFKNTLKRDAIKLSITAVALILFASVFSTVMTSMFSSQVEILGMYATLQNPAMIALCGPTFATADNVTTAAFYAQEMLLFTALIVIVVMVLHTISRTRAEEDEGLTELLGSFPVGRHVISVSIAVEMFLFSLVTGFGIAFLQNGLVGTDNGFTLEGNFLYAFALSGSGFMFAMLGLLFAQLFDNASTATTASMLVLGILYALRAITDIRAIDLSRFNPLSWAYMTSPFVRNSWLYLALMVLVALALFALSMLLQGKRDLGAGYITWREKKYKENKLLHTTFGFAFNLMKSQVVIWVISTFVLGILYGSIFGDIDKFVADNQMLEQFFSAGSGVNLADSFLATIMLEMAVLAMVPMVSFINRLAKEERLGNLDMLLNKTSRLKLQTSFLILGLGVGIICLFAVSLGLYIAQSVVMTNPISWSQVLQTAACYLPAVCLFAGFALLMVAINRKYGLVTWYLLVVSFYMDYVGQLLDLPTWVKNLSPFKWIPHLPVDKMHWQFAWVMLIFAITFIGLSLVIYRKRDI